MRASALRGVAVCLASAFLACRIEIRIASVDTDKRTALDWSPYAETEDRSRVAAVRVVAVYRANRHVQASHFGLDQRLYGRQHLLVVGFIELDVGTFHNAAYLFLHSIHEIGADDRGWRAGIRIALSKTVLVCRPWAVNTKHWLHPVTKYDLRVCRCLISDNTF